MIENNKKNDKENIDPLRELRLSINTLEKADPLKNYWESIEAAQKLNASFKTSVESAERLKASFENSIEYAQRLKASFENSIEAAQFARSLKDIIESEKSIKFVYSNINRSIDVYRNIFKDSIPATNFGQAYQEVVSKIIIAKKDNDIDGAISVVAAEIEQKIKIAPKSFLSIEFYMNFILSLIIFLYSMHLSTESENRLTQQITNAKSAIIEKIEEFLTTKKSFIYYVVLRPVNLRLKPTTKKSQVINIIYPNQTVRLIERKGKWIKVEYFNHISGLHEHGWCYKKYLKIIQVN